MAYGDFKSLLRRTASDMQLISEFNKTFSFLLCVIDIYIKFALVILLKDKKVLELLRDFKKY